MSAPKDKLRQLLRSAKNSLKTYNEVEKRVREATSNDPWPSTSTLMMRIVADTDDHFLYDSMLSMLLKRLQDTSQIMHVKKALILADFLLRNAGGRFINDMKSRLHIFENLSSYRYLVEGSDKGADVRVKAERMLELLQNDDLLRHERESSRRLKERMGAISYKHTYNASSPHQNEFDRVDALDFDGQHTMHNNNLRIEPADHSASTLSNSSLSDSPSVSATSPRHRRRQEREQKRGKASKKQRTSKKKAIEARRRSSSSLSDVAFDDANTSSEPEEYIVPPQPRAQSKKKKNKKKRVQKEVEKEVPADDWLMHVSQAPPQHQQQHASLDGALIKDETPALLDVMQPKLDDKQSKPKSNMQQIEYPQAQLEYPQAQLEYPTRNHMAIEYRHAPQPQQPQQQMVPHGHYDQMQYQHYMQQQQQQQLQLQHRQQQPMLALPYPQQQTQALVPSSNLPF